MTKTIMAILVAATAIGLDVPRALSVVALLYWAADVAIEWRNKRRKK